MRTHGLFFAATGFATGCAAFFAGTGLVAAFLTGVVFLTCGAGFLTGVFFFGGMADVFFHVSYDGNVDAAIPLSGMQVCKYAGMQVCK